MNRKLVFGLMLLVMAFAAVACGGGGGTSNNTSSSTSGGSPADAVKAYFNASLLGEGDGASMLCSSIPADVKQQMQSGFDSLKSTYAASGAKLDLSGLTFTEQNVSGDTGEVVVAGKLKVSISGTDQEIDYPSATIPVKNESGWKVCG